MTLFRPEAGEEHLDSAVAQSTLRHLAGRVVALTKLDLKGAGHDDTPAEVIKPLNVDRGVKVDFDQTPRRTSSLVACISRLILEDRDALLGSMMADSAAHDADRGVVIDDADVNLAGLWRLSMYAQRSPGLIFPVARIAQLDIDPASGDCRGTTVTYRPAQDDPNDVVSRYAPEPHGTLQVRWPSMVPLSPEDIADWHICLNIWEQTLPR